MTMTVAFSESDISKIKVGQPADITLEALSGVELAAHVSAISTLGTTSSGVVSYNATLTLDQRDSRVKPGMSASAAVVTGQASGVNLPNSAVTTTGSVGRVNLLKDGKATPTTVVVGLVGDSRTQIVSGLRAGDQVQVTTTLPALGSGYLAVVVGLHRDARRSRRPRRGRRCRAVPRWRWRLRRRRRRIPRRRRAAGSAVGADGSAPSRHRP